MNPQAIQAVKSRLVLSDVVRRYVDLRPVSGRFMGACPFHQETKPSMSVNDEEGFFYCFGCQASGDVIDFYKRINGLEFREALEQLAAEAGVDLGDQREDPEAQERQRRKKILLDMHEQAREFFRAFLRKNEGRAARAYLAKRGIEPRIVESFGLGYSPDDWHALDQFLQSKHHTPELGVEAGLLSKNDKGNIYDRFRARLIFPIQNLSGRVIAFGGRIISEGEPKYLNSSDTPIYKKGEHLYGLYQARPTMTRSKRALLTEGYMDVLSLHQFGYTDACGVLGTALTGDQVRRLAGFCSRVDLVFDGDNAGRKAALKSSEMILLQGVACRVILLPEGEDVDSVLQKEGPEGFEKCLKAAKDGLTFALDTLRDQFAPRETMAWAKDFFEKLADDGLRAYYLPRLVSGLGVSEVELRQALGTSRAGRDAPRERASLAAVRPVGKDDKNDREYLRFPIQYPEYVRDLADRGFERVLTTDWARGLWEKIRLHDGQELVSWLDESEKKFWARCRQERAEHTLTGEMLKDEWLYICDRVAESHEKHARRQLTEALREALKEGDSRQAQEHLQALNVFLGRDDEQH
ncbi:DNA primase [Desulfovibrio aminophilus]|uniref:DNA primase n=1 Tax=Desulfovibrio aminophilus TaxID=81425 RepID=UPI003390A494